MLVIFLKAFSFIYYTFIIQDSSELTRSPVGFNFAQLSRVTSSSSDISTPINTSPPTEDFPDLELFSSSMRKDILGPTGLPTLGSPSESPLTSPALLSPDNPPPHSEFVDCNTQMSVVDHTASLHLDDQNTLWNVNIGSNSDDDDGDVSRKALKAHRSSDAASTSNNNNVEDEKLDKGFEIELATSNVSQPFIFNKFGTDVPTLFKFGTEPSNTTAFSATNRYVGPW